MANIMSQVKLKNRTSRNAFDLSRKNAFTAKVGELLPVACIECIPGDKIKGRVQHFTRTMPVNTAAYTRIREYYDWFFVPTNLLWNKFNTFVTQMTDNNQHATSISSSQILTNMHPYITCSQISNYLSEQISQDQKNYFAYSRAELSMKLLHYLGYGDFYEDSEGVKPKKINANLNPFPLLAYQKIYQDYFRNSQWEKADATSFNIDYISGASSSLNLPISTLTSTLENHARYNLFDLRYCNWNKDLFMGVLPNAQYGAASAFNFTNTFTLPAPTSFTAPGTILSSGEPVSSESNVYVAANATQARTSAGPLQLYLGSGNVNVLRNSLGLNVPFDVASNFSILQLRQAEALQKWKEITQSQQQDYKNQIEAHFGVSVSDAYSERCRYIDGSVSNLDISEVLNNNITGSFSADIAGKGVGVGDGNINFSSDVHGYLMCIYHAVPLLDYATDGVNKCNLKTMVTDYAIPEFDATGMVGVPTVELTNNGYLSRMPEFLGYAPRYYDYKTAVDEVHGAFVNGGLGAWVAPLDYSYFKRYFDNHDPYSIDYTFFKVNPATLNPIFAQDVDSNTATDQLLVNASIELTAVRNLDRNGLPY